MHAQWLGKFAIGSAAFGAAAAAVLVLAAASAPTLEAKLGILGVELSLSIGDAPSTGTPAYLEASMLRKNQDDRMSGVALRVAKSGGLRAPAAAPAPDTSVNRAAATATQAPAEPRCAI
ncbi:MAG TPA: hypothetical protein VGV37_01470 [Aliidongia sp.]|uniref:hypothetical protein n=1 Tax=Aliidongia sp. TaxID=1914230 RepID=UPI002DDD1971|nr:hypothetical protein [Aliidongia sp.]HEV2673178.1 hypothetical protein [Aliidongia sp.]